MLNTSQEPPVPTKALNQGLKKLEKRVKEGEIVIVQTDKSGKLAAMDLETYEKMGAEHVKGDIRVSWKHITDAQAEIKGHLDCLNKVFNTGEAHGENGAKRCREAKSVANLTIPQLYLLLKDHKKVGEDGLPKSRPVCGASCTINQEMSE